MAIDIEVLSDTAFDEAIAAAKGQREDLKAYIDARARIIAEGAAALVKDRIAGDIEDEDVRFAWNEIRATERTARLAVEFSTRAALQDAINAALAVAVAVGAINQAIGIKVI